MKEGMCWTSHWCVLHCLPQCLACKYLWMKGRWTGRRKEKAWNVENKWWKERAIEDQREKRMRVFQATLSIMGVDDLGRSSGISTWFLEGKPGMPPGIVDLRKWPTSFIIRLGSQWFLLWLVSFQHDTLEENILFHTWMGEVLGIVTELCT